MRWPHFTALKAILSPSSRSWLYVFYPELNFFKTWWFRSWQHALAQPCRCSCFGRRCKLVYIPVTLPAQFQPTTPLLRLFVGSGCLCRSISSSPSKQNIPRIHSARSSLASSSSCRQPMVHHSPLQHSVSSSFGASSSPSSQVLE